jgi:cellulose synthase/poly-beta-1,6-N-acetylglucosamine synthase-like glycosyltransferase/peptidoglycan/xylan/chitin deacetylase (PgdA/CDA1 family)/spore germination protein YaaH
MAQPVFFDPRQTRWKRVRRFFDVLGVVIGLLVCFFGYKVLLSSDRLPELLLPMQKKSFHALKENEKEHSKEKRRLAAVKRGHRKSKGAASQVKLNAEEGIRAAFYVQWDAASFSSLREYAHQIDLLYPEWLHMLTPDGRIQGVDPQTNNFFDLTQHNIIQQVDDKLMPFLKSEDTGTEVFPLVNNFDGVDWVDITPFLNSPEARTRFRQELTGFLASDKYQGVMIDFEAFPKKGQPGFLALLNELSSDLHAKSLKLYVAVPSHNDEWNYQKVAAVADGVVLMNYDEHYPGGDPGPIASQSWFVKNLEFAKKVIPQEKLICAIANFGYDWPQKPKRGKLPEDEKDKNQTVQDAWLAARDSESDVEFDNDSLTPHVKYLDERNLQHDIWFLDAVTALNQMRAAQTLGINTFALWRLGAEDRSLWRVWDIPGEAAAPEHLKDVPPGQDVDMEGRGEILRVEARPDNGQRKIEVDPDTGLIIDQSMESLPEPYRVGRYGANDKQVALTFDDGPDPEWTPKILDVLKEKQAPATFFLIGIQTAKFSDLASRINRDGHEIGNHTFTHPDISDISTKFAKLEMNLTEQLFASRLGVRTILFRPPYSIDQEPDTEDQVRPLETTQQLGYITIGDKLDPRDWQDNPRLTAQQITDEVLAHLPPCSQYDPLCGNIVLLHDGGGDRQQTVLALPMIIDGVRARGFKIVSVHELLGKTRAEIMPPIPRSERWSAGLIWINFWMFDMGLKTIAWIFLIGDVLMTGRLLFVGALAIWDRVREHRFGRPGETLSYRPKVAVLIPAYNEEKVIRRTIHAALNSSYRNLRVIVIDDGSKDATLEVARQAFALEQQSGKVLILTKPNAGKAEALNYGLEHVTNEELFVGIDADTVIASDAIAYLVPHFLNLEVAAVAGNAKVGNRVNLWTRWQALEYITSQNFERRALNTLGTVSVVPGAIGAWRISAVREVGHYHTDTVAEDADLTMALLRRGYRVEYEDRAVAYTEAPTNSNGLMRQRFRWSFGILQSVWKHRGASAKKGALGWVALPNIWIFQILLPLVSPFIDIGFAVGAIWYYVQKWFHPDSTDPASFHRLVIFFVAFLIIDFITSSIAFALERRQRESREDAWLLSQVWLQRFAYRQLFSVVLFKTLKRAIQGKQFAWDKLERTAAMTYSPKEREEQPVS